MPIKYIFFDIDETLISTRVDQRYSMDNIETFVGETIFTLPDDPTTYLTIIRPTSHDLIQFSRDLVGHENVYILTAATRDYAHEINRIADWKFNEDHIIPREDLIANRDTLRLDRDHKHPLHHSSNILIDNLPYYDNRDKIKLIGLDPEFGGYFKVEDYYGTVYEYADGESDEEFAQSIKEYLTKRHK